MAHREDSQKVNDDPSASMQLVSAMKGEIAALHDAMRVEIARSDFLWDRALARGLVSEEEYALAQDPAKLSRVRMR